MLAHTTEIKTGEDCFLNLETVLHSEALLALIKGQLLAIRVRHYYPENFCQRVQERLSSEERMGVYSTFGAEEIGRDRLSYYNPRAREIRIQLAANVYLNMPESGGSLSLWDASMLPENLSDCRRQGGYGFDPEKIGPPKLEIQPEIGDLILFNSRYLHSVSRVGVGGRLSSSCFIGFRSFNRPLSYWS